MTDDWRQQAQQVVEQGKRRAGGMVSGGEMLIDADPRNGFFRVKLRNVHPPEVVAQLVTGFVYVLAQGGAMLNLQVKQRTRRSGEP